MTTDNDKASARPWGAFSSVVRDANHNDIALCAPVGRDPETDANAELIARAVNAYDALVSALTACMMALGRGGANVAGGPNRAEWEGARSALRIAEDGR